MIKMVSSQSVEMFKISNRLFDSLCSAAGGYDRREAGSFRSFKGENESF